eukprot:8864482-Karenia_brevis.AAC.1
MSLEVFRKYADSLLGAQVYSMPMHEGITYRLPWSIVLSYELELRRDACRKVTEEGMTFAKAMEESCRDTYI